MVKKVSSIEMRNVEGGASITCICGQTFKDYKIGKWTIISCSWRYLQHKKNRRCLEGFC